MSFTRIYQAIPLILHTSIYLDQKASHHVARVLRAKGGDKIRLFNGECEGDYEAVITHIDKKSVKAEIVTFLPRTAESPVKIYLAQGMARGEKMDFIVQKAVELGVSKIIPLVTERCTVKLDTERKINRLTHWRAIVTSACEQSGRNQVPEVCAPLALSDWLPSVNAEQCFVLSPHRQEKLPGGGIVRSKSASIALLIGPEGGLTEHEVERALNQGFKPLNLGPRTLRTETATIAAITIFQSFYGDMGSD